MVDYGKIRMRSLAGFFVCQIWIFWFYLVLVFDNLDVDCWQSSWGDEDIYCYATLYGDFDIILIMLPILHSVSFPLFYYMFYTPQVWYAEMKEGNTKEVIKEVEVVKEVFREPLPIPPPLPQHQGIVIKNYQVKDGVVTEEL